MNLLICLVLTLLALSPPPQITGTLIDSDGKAVSGVTISVVALPSDRVMEKTVSGSDGSFDVSGLAAGAYGVEARTDSACAISNAIAVTTGSTSAVRLQLVKGLCQNPVEFVKPPGNGANEKQAAGR